MKQNIPITIDGQSRSLEPVFSGLPDGTRASSLYLHVPFCFHKCHYCDFYSFVDSRDQQGAFVDALEIEIERIAPWGPTPAPLDTIFVGGGTPTLLTVPLWERLLNTLDRLFPLAQSPQREMSIECNPETATKELFDVLHAGGFNRISIGAQSFDAGLLKVLERWHEPDSVKRALALAQRAGIDRASIDLIFAIPGQSLEMWDRELDVLCSFAREGLIDHASCYALTYEPNTAMTTRLNRGEFDPIDEDTEAAMYERTVERLAEVGLERYEVSNFAKPGSECRHNLAYWQQLNWLAAGPSASGHMGVGSGVGSGGGGGGGGGWVGGHLWKNVPRLGDWMKSVTASGGWCEIVDHEPPDARRSLAERIMLGVRIAEGIPMSELISRSAPLGAADRMQTEIYHQQELGFVAPIEDVLRLTDPGFLHADGVASALMQTLGH